MCVCMCLCVCVCVCMCVCVYVCVCNELSASREFVFWDDFGRTSIVAVINWYSCVPQVNSDVRDTNLRHLKVM